MMVFHVLISPAIEESPVFEVYREPLDLEHEGIYNGGEFDIVLYRIPFEKVSEHDFTNGMMAAMDAIEAMIGMKYMGNARPTLH